jgi:ABC-type multidrug transport system permease subunit
MIILARENFYMGKRRNVMSHNAPPTLSGFRGKVLFNFGLFTIFFVFYLGAAVIQTPSFKDIAALPAMGMPLGLLLSLLIFPVSWAIMVYWFWRAK